MSFVNTTISTTAIKKQVYTEKDPLIAFKGFNKGYTCRGYQFLPNVTHSITNKKKIKLCENGFHACKFASKVSDFYDVHYGVFVYGIVHQWGTVDSDNIKQASKHIKLVKKLSNKKMEALHDLDVRLALADVDEHARHKALIEIAMAM